MADAPYTRVPVYRGSFDQVAGFLHTKDVLLRQMAAGGAPVSVGDLVRPIVSVPAQASADRVLVMLRERRVQLGLVVGDKGEVVGLITLEDVLSEVFGALSDELKDSLRSRPRKRPPAPGA